MYSNENKKNLALLVFIIIVFVINIPIPYLQQNYILMKIYNYLPLIVLPISLINIKKVDIAIILAILYYVVFAFATMINSNYEMNIIYINLIRAFNIFMISKYAIMKKPRIYVKAAAIFFTTYIFINFITIILFPNGLYHVDKNINNHFFLGHRNNTIEFILPTLLFVNLDRLLNNKNKFMLIMVLIISILSVLITWSVNSIIAVFVVLLYFVFEKSQIISKIMNFMRLFVATMVITVLFAVMKIQYLFEWFITGVFHKSLTFTGRTEIWDKAIFYIKQSPVWGYGNEDVLIKASKINHSSSCHNYFLDFLYSGGIVLLSVMMALCLAVGVRLYKVINTPVMKKVANTFIGVFAGMFVIWIATPIHLQSLSQLFLLFILAYNINLFAKNRTTEEVK